MNQPVEPSLLIPIGKRKGRVTEEHVRRAQRDLLNGTIAPHDIMLIDAILSHFCREINQCSPDATS